jgi:hypothetical protein
VTGQIVNPASTRLLKKFEELIDGEREIRLAIAPAYVVDCNMGVRRRAGGVAKK